MKLVRQYVRTSAGILLRSTSIAIYLGDGVTPCTLYAVDGTVVTNPTRSSESGVVQFYVQDSVSSLTYRPITGLVQPPVAVLPMGVNDLSSSVKNSTMNGIATSSITMGQALRGDSLGKFIPCVASNTCVGIATQSATPGQPIAVLTQGVLENAGFNFIPEGDIYIGPSGFLTQNVPNLPAMTFSQKIGIAITSTKILVSIEPPIDLV